MAHAIDELRDELVQPGKILRLIGLSGVGKPRLVQALFDARIGSRPLPSSLAVCTNVSDNPDPQPTGLASDQRQDSNNALLLAAQACSLVYSFQGEALTGEEAELPRLASLAGPTAAETYGHVGELLRRDLVQQRGVWRAALPHAIANRLAPRALDDTPWDLIDQQLVVGGTERREFTADPVSAEG